jgi:hypothetical protein
MKKGNYLIKLNVKSAIDSGGAGNTRKSPQFRGFEKRTEREINSLFLCASGFEKLSMALVYDSFMVIWNT